MPKTKVVFSGSSGCSTSFGFVNVSATKELNKANIDFMIAGRSQEEAVRFFSQLQVLSRRQVCWNTLFKKSAEKNNRTLINHWDIYQKNDTVIAYPHTDRRQAVLFTSKHDVFEDLNKLLEAPLYQVDYLNEIKFCQLLEKKLKSNGFEFRALPGMTEDKACFFIDNARSFETLLDLGWQVFELANQNLKQIQYLITNVSKIDKLNEYLVEYKSSISDLRKINGFYFAKFDYFISESDVVKAMLDAGISVRELAATNLKFLKRLKKCAGKMDKLTQFVTVQQLLGTGHKHPEIPENTSPFNIYNCLGGVSSGSCSDYSYKKEFNTRKSSKCTVTYKKNGTTLQYETVQTVLNKEGAEKFSASNIQVCRKTVYLVHKWVVDIFPKQGGQEKLFRSIFSSDNNNLIVDEWDQAFPISKILDDFLFSFNLNPFYKEKHFERTLKKHGVSCEVLRHKYKMSQSRLKILLENDSCLSDLIKKGATFDDLAQADEPWLAYILSNSYEINDVLQFVDMQELLGVKSSALQNDPDQVVLHNKKRKISRSITHAFFSGYQPESSTKKQCKSYSDQESPQKVANRKTEFQKGIDSLPTNTCVIL